MKCKGNASKPIRLNITYDAGGIRAKVSNNLSIYLTRNVETASTLMQCCINIMCRLVSIMKDLMSLIIMSMGYTARF